MKRNEFVFLIGFEGKSAFVDSAMVKRFGRKSTRELLELGYYKAAFCSALYENKTEAEDELVAWFGEHDIYAGKSFSELKVIFGVKGVPENVQVVSV